MAEKVKKILRGPLISSIFYVALGLVLTLLPVESVNIICKVVFGFVMILAGVYHILIHLLELNNSTILDLFSGVILTVFGVFLFMNPLIVVKLLPILLGAFLLVDSLWTIRGAFKLKKLRRGSWKLLIITSILFIGAGIFLIVNPLQVVKHTIMAGGIALILNGTFDLIYWVMLLVAQKKGIREEMVEEPSVQPEENEESKPEVMEPVYDDWNSHIETTPMLTEVPAEENPNPPVIHLETETEIQNAEAESEPEVEIPAEEEENHV